MKFSALVTDSSCSQAHGATLTSIARPWPNLGVPGLAKPTGMEGGGGGGGGGNTMITSAEFNCEKKTFCGNLIWQNKPRNECNLLNMFLTPNTITLSRDWYWGLTQLSLYLSIHDWNSDKWHKRNRQNDQVSLFMNWQHEKIGYNKHEWVFITLFIAYYHLQKNRVNFFLKRMKMCTEAKWIFNSSKFQSIRMQVDKLLRRCQTSLPSSTCSWQPDHTITASQSGFVATEMSAPKKSFHFKNTLQITIYSSQLS